MLIARASEIAHGACMYPRRVLSSTQDRQKRQMEKTHIERMCHSHRHCSHNNRIGRDQLGIFIKPETGISKLVITVPNNPLNTGPAFPVQNIAIELTPVTDLQYRYIVETCLSLPYLLVHPALLCPHPSARASRRPHHLILESALLHVLCQNTRPGTHKRSVLLSIGRRDRAPISESTRPISANNAALPRPPVLVFVLELEVVPVLARGHSL